MILAGDIGGTHTRLALFECDGELKMGAQETFASGEHPGLLPIVKAFLEKHPATISSACFGIAGPIQDGKCQATNLPWVVDRREFVDALHIESVFLLNDLESNAWGLRVLKENDFCVLQKGSVQSSGNACLISAGTGLGQAGLFWDGKELYPFACEGGHADFAPRNAMEIDLFAYLKKKFPDHVSYERLISGPGLKNIYDFFIATKREMLSSEVMHEMKERDPSLVISEWGSLKKDRGCERALEMFVSLYGAEAGNLALKFLARGGVYIGGGIAPKILDAMQSGRFMESFKAKGRFKDFLSTVPVFVVLNDQTALLGSAEYARRKK